MVIHQDKSRKVKGYYSSVTCSHRSCFRKGKEYSDTFTDRQQAIINCEYVPNLRRRDISEVVNKAIAMENYELAYMVSEMYDNIEREAKQPTREELASARASLDEIKNNLFNR